MEEKPLRSESEPSLDWDQTSVSFQVTDKNGYPSLRPLRCFTMDLDQYA